MFLIGAIKPIVEKKFKTYFRGVESVQNKTGFVSLWCRFGGGKKSITQKKGKNRFEEVDLKYFYLLCIS